VISGLGLTARLTRLSAMSEQTSAADVEGSGKEVCLKRINQAILKALRRTERLLRCISSYRGTVYSVALCSH
jgi:hypothetical protein